MIATIPPLAARVSFPQHPVAEIGVKLGDSIRLILILTLFMAPGCTALRNRRVANEQFDRAVYAQEAGNTQVAIDALRQATKAKPKFVEAHDMLGGLYKDQGDYESAEKEYQTLTQLQPKKSGNFYNLGLMNQLLGRLQKATQGYTQAIKLEPKDADSHMNLGLVYLALGDRQRAINYLQKATVLNPTSIEAWTNYGAALDENDDLVAAEKAYRKALELDGNRYNVFIDYAGNLLAQKRPDEAIRFLQQAADMKDGAVVQKLMGDALAAKGWTQAAVARYDRAIKFDPQYISAYNALGETLITAYEKGMQLNESQRERAVAAWRASLAVRLDQPTVAERLSKWAKSN